MKRKRIEEYFFIVLMVISILVITGALLSILFAIFNKGISSLSWEMLSSLPKGGYYFGKEGGILNAIVGSLYLAFGATLLALLISIPVALYMNVFLKNKKRLLSSLRFFMDVLWGIPSIVYGAFGFTLMVMLGIKTSLLAGIVIVGVFITPIMVRAMDEVLMTIPIGMMEAAYSLGCTRTETAFKFFLRKVAPGMVTAVLLAFGRAIGDAAVVLFTTGYTDYIPQNINQPAATLPLAIFFQLGSPVDEVKNRAYSAALVLTIIILVISLAARFFTWYFNRKNA